MATIPKILPVFPLTGVIIPPGAVLPFAIFEPRYIAMMEDVMKNGRYLIITQPKGEEGKGKFPPLYNIGTLCKVVFFDEENPSRYRITAMGMQRLKLEKEQAMKKGYRRFSFQRKGFEQDLLKDDFEIADRKAFFSILSKYLERFERDISWDDFKKLDDEKILLVVMITFPFTSAEKQALLEAKNSHERFDLLVALLEMAMKDRELGKKSGFWDDAERRVLQ